VQAAATVARARTAILAVRMRALQLEQATVRIFYLME
jgi:hypothetical protein